MCDKFNITPWAQKPGTGHATPTKKHILNWYKLTEFFAILLNLNLRHDTVFNHILIRDLKVLSDQIHMHHIIMTIIFTHIVRLKSAEVIFIDLL